ncbi:MAG: SOS response-associated peptidase [candidate division WOR-3 bacterium]
MCGRYVLHVSLSEITEEFEIYDVDLVWVPNFNIAPGNNIPAVVNDNQNKLSAFHWGLIPSWSKDQNVGFRMINARAETLAQKPSFSRILKTQRCIIPASGFYEWHTDEEKKTKIPFYFHLKSDRLMGFAGLYDLWRSPSGKIIKSCTIITTTANELVGQYHNRMPVILEPEKRKIWLDRKVDNPADLLPLLKPFSSKEIEAYEVSKMVNSPKINTPDCIKPKRDSA